MTRIEELDRRLAAVRADNRRVREETIAEWEAELAVETNPYARESLIRALERFRELDAG